MGSPMCDHCNIGRATVYCKTHVAKVCLQCDWTLHYVTLDSPDHSRFLLCNICVSQAAAVQCLEQGLSLCQTCVSKANVTSSFIHCNVSNSYSGYSFPPDLDPGSSSSSSYSSFIDLNWRSPFVPLPPKNGDSLSSSRIFQNFDNHTKNNSDQQVEMLQANYMDTPKDSSCLSFEGYEAKDIDNSWLFDDDKPVRDQKEYFSGEDLILTDQLIDEIIKHNAETPTEIISAPSAGMSSVIHQEYNIEALANASCEDYKKNQMIGSKTKEETNNNIGIFPDCRQSQLILTDVHEMLPWEDQTLAVYTPQRRLDAVKKYLAKKKKRKFGKQIRYESRKSTADTKKRLKGRFTKAGEEYDYDPRANNINEELIKP